MPVHERPNGPDHTISVSPRSLSGSEPLWRGSGDPHRMDLGLGRPRGSAAVAVDLTAAGLLRPLGCGAELPVRPTPPNRPAEGDCRDPPNSRQRRPKERRPDRFLLSAVHFGGSPTTAQTQPSGIAADRCCRARWREVSSDTGGRTPFLGVRCLSLNRVSPGYASKASCQGPPQERQPTTQVVVSKRMAIGG